MGKRMGALTPLMSSLHRVKINELWSTNLGVYDAHLTTILGAKLAENRKKSPYLSNGVIDCREIWHGDAFWQGLAGYRWALPRISSF